MRQPKVIWASAKLNGGEVIKLHFRISKNLENFCIALNDNMDTYSMYFNK